MSGGLSTLWTRISEGIDGAFHLDSRALHRLPEEEAEIEILISRVRDRAALLNVEEVTEVDVHDYWLVSRLPAGEPAGLTVVGAPSAFNASDGAAVRRLLRRAVRRASEQREVRECEFAVLALVASVAHIADEMATAGAARDEPRGLRLARPDRAGRGRAGTGGATAALAAVGELIGLPGRPDLCRVLDWVFQDECTGSAPRTSSST